MLNKPVRLNVEEARDLAEFPTRTALHIFVDRALARGENVPYSQRRRAEQLRATSNYNH